MKNRPKKKQPTGWMKHRSQLPRRKMPPVKQNQPGVLVSGVTRIFLPGFGKQEDLMQAVLSDKKPWGTKYFMFKVFFEGAHIYCRVYNMSKRQMRKRGLCHKRVVCDFTLRSTPSGHLTFDLKPCINQGRGRETHSLRYTLNKSGPDIHTAPAMKGVGVKLSLLEQGKIAA